MRFKNSAIKGGIDRLRSRISEFFYPRHSSRTPPLHTTFAIGRPWLAGFLNSIRVDATGLIRINGWYKEEFNPDYVPTVYLDGKPVPFLQFFRFLRSDVGPAPAGTIRRLGLALDYLVPESLTGRAKTLDIQLSKTRRLRFSSDFDFVNPHYRALFGSLEVFHREDIYCSGPPNLAVHPDVLELAKELQGPVLDFGCGRGALLSQLQQIGVEVHGLELNSPTIRAAIPPALATFIKLYDGSFPSPFPDGSFRSVICTEVLEHVPDYQAAIRDIARIVTDKVIFTVPDAGAIPVGYCRGVVPWHLLEGTHVNFFSQRSLCHALEPYFRRLEFGRIDASYLNDTPFYVSLSAVCLK